MPNLLSQLSKFGWLIGLTHSNQLPFDGNLQAQSTNGIIIGTIKRTKRRSRSFGRSIPPHKSIIKQQQHLGYLIVPGNSNRTQQIINGIIPRLSNWHLRSSDNNSLLQILNHKGKTTGSEAHRIRPMQHNKRIIFFIVLLYRLEDRIYPRDVHVGGIDQMLQLDEFIPYLLLENSLGSYREALRSDEVCLFLIAKIRIGLQELLKSIPLRLEFPIVILEHTDSSPRMYNQDLSIVLVHA